MLGTGGTRRAVMTFSSKEQTRECRFDGLKCALSMLTHERCLDFVNRKSAKGQTVLMKACFANEDEFVQILLNNGADPLVTNNRGNSALDIAKLAGAGPRVRQLLNAASER